MASRRAGCMGKPLVRFCEGQECNCDMEEILWHCRETRQPTEKTNINLRYRQGEIPEGLSGSERLACKKRSVENLGGPIGSQEWGRVCGY